MFRLYRSLLQAVYERSAKRLIVLSRDKRKEQKGQREKIQKEVHTGRDRERNNRERETKTQRYRVSERQREEKTKGE